MVRMGLVTVGFYLIHTLSGTLGVTPRQKDLPVFDVNMEKEENDKSEVAAKKAASLLALLNTQSAWGGSTKLTRVWLGEGLGSVSKRTYDTMMRWGFVDLGDFQSRGAIDKLVAESDTEKLVVLPGFEVSQARRKPISSITVWCQCFARYTAAMAKQFPSCTLDFMSHQVTVLKAYMEVEDQAWRLYDEALREKMAAIGQKEWKGMDLALYQEICGGRQRKLTIPAKGSEAGSSGRGKRPLTGKRPRVCWDFNQRGNCSFGKSCKFAHECENCGGNHPKFRCNGAGGSAEKYPRQA